MIITCDQCQAKFKVAPESIKETGSKVRCSSCRHVFTVYRHQEPPKPRPALAASPGGEDGLDDYFDSYQNRSEASSEDYDSGDLFDDKSRLSRALRRDDADEFEDPEDGLDDFQVDDDDGPHLAPPDDARSIRERRDQRRRFYADLPSADTDGEEEPDSDFDPDSIDDDDSYADEEPHADEDGDYEDGEYEDEEYDDDAEYEDGEEYDEEYEDEDGEYEEGDYDDQDLNRYDLPKNKRPADGLGLGADPTTVIDDNDYSGPAYGSLSGGLREPTAIRAAVTKAPGNSKKLLILVLAIVAACLAIGIFFLSSRPERTALSGDETGAAAEEAAETARTAGDQTGTEGITFTRGTQSHFIRDNKEAGKILIITGMVRNSYTDSRKHIRLRGHLLSVDGMTLADRFVYAGNILTEEELINLPMLEIVTRLSIKGGQNNQNMNVAPGAEIPFMVVFNNLPENMTEYRIDPVGSEPAGN